MPAPLIPIIAGVAARTVAGTAGRAVVGQAVKTGTQQAARKGIGRTASGKTLQAAKPRTQWDWKDMASNFVPNNEGDSV
jgi:hypothetical protein